MRLERLAQPIAVRLVNLLPITALVAAAMKGHLDVVRLLVRAGAKLEATTSRDDGAGANVVLVRTQQPAVWPICIVCRS